MKRLSWVPADKSGNNAIVFDGITIQYLSTAKTYELISADEKSVANKNFNDIVTKFAFSIIESQEGLLTFYLQPKLH